MTLDSDPDSMSFQSARLSVSSGVSSRDSLDGPYDEYYDKLGQALNVNGRAAAVWVDEYAKRVSHASFHVNLWVEVLCIHTLEPCVLMYETCIG